MDKKLLCLALVTSLFFLTFSAAAQQPKKVPLIGYLSSSDAATVSARVEAFRRGLRELGYVEGKNIVIEWRYAEGKLDRQSHLAAELVRLKVDVIVTAGATTTRVAKEATVTTPIVMMQDPDPIGNGFVASLARPGGNITGLSALSTEISGKRLELLKEILPKLSRVAVLGSSITPSNAQALRETELAAGVFGLQLQILDIRGPKDIEPAFRSASKERADGIHVLQGTVLLAHRTQVVGFAAKNRLPAMYVSPDWVEAGGLMSYGVSCTDLYQRAAYYVDKILKGAKPADLPVEQPTKFELIVKSQSGKTDRSDDFTQHVGKGG